MPTKGSRVDKLNVWVADSLHSTSHLGDDAPRAPNMVPQSAVLGRLTTATIATMRPRAPRTMPMMPIVFAESTSWQPDATNRAEKPRAARRRRDGLSTRRYLCHECQVMFETHPAGGLVEVEG